jgi:hypothetical protein
MWRSGIGASFFEDICSKRTYAVAIDSLVSLACVLDASASFTAFEFEKELQALRFGEASASEAGEGFSTSFVGLEDWLFKRYFSAIEKNVIGRWELIDVEDQFNETTPLSNVWFAMRRLLSMVLLRRKTRN